ALLQKYLIETASAGELTINLDLDLGKQKLLDEIADTIIPETDTPGAKKLNVHLFVMKMMSDCYEKNILKRFLSGLSQIDEASIAKNGKTFLKSSTTERKALLASIQKKEAHHPDVLYFFPLMKTLTLQGYLNCEYVMTNLTKYELVPARFNGYFPVQ